MLSKIHRIELNNFKSYNGSVTIGPFKDFTCIVGSNGSGKSNLMDALSFVLSTSATSTLRGKKAVDFINRQSKKSECSVTIFLRQEQQKQKAPASRENQVETAFTRTVNKDGKIAVLINHASVTEKQFTEALERHRIGSRVNTFLVFQHEVEAVAQKKAKELTDLLEQVSGSGELKHEYNSRKTAMEAANDALTNASLEKRGAVVAVNQMRLAKKEAERFEEVRRRQAEERRDLALTELFSVELELEKQKDELDRFNKSLEELQKGITTEEGLREMKRKYAEHHKKYLEDLKKTRRAAEDLRGKVNMVDRIKATLEHLGRKHDIQKKELQTLNHADSVRSSEVQRLEDELKKQQAILRNYDETCVREDKENTSLNGALDGPRMAEYRQLRKEADCETVTLRQQTDTIKRARDSAQQALKQCEVSAEAHEMQRLDLEQATERVRAHLQDLEQRRKDLDATRIGLEKQIDTARKELVNTQRKNKEREGELAKIQEQLHELRYVKDSDKQNSKMADALQALRSLFPIRGRLVDLCSVPNDRYKNAVTVAMGKNLEAIVVNTADVAISCVKYLKEQRMPPMTFLPLDSVTGAPVDDRLRTFGGSCKPLVDVVRYDAELEPAVRYALAQTLVCDALPEAKRVAYGNANGERHKVVTLDGTMLLKNGSVQGGLASIQSRSRKWDEKKYDDLRAARERILSDAAGGSEAELARAQIAIRDMESRHEFTVSRLKVVETERVANETKLKNCLEEAKRHAGNGAALKEREARYKEELESISRELLHASQAIAKVEGRVFAEFQKKVNIPNLLQLEERQAQLAKQRAEHRQQLQFLIHKLSRSIDVETKRVGGQSLADVKELYKRLEKEIEECQKNLVSHQKSISTSEASHEQSKLTVSKARERLDQLEGQIRQTTRESETMLTRLAHARKGATGLQVACDTLRLRRLDLVRRCQMDETDIPLKPLLATLGVKRGRDKETTRAARVGGVNQAAAAEEGQLLVSEPMELLSSSSQQGHSSKDSVCVDFSAMTSALRQVATDRARFNAYKQRTDALIESLTAEMEALAPNMKAASKYIASEDRLGASSTVLDEARDRAREAHNEFLKVRELRRTRFMDVYEKVAANVDRVYQELTLGTRAHAVHGSAYLSLEDMEEPYLGGTTYHATPPLKRFMPMELLSGGERTMAALALLFAIHAVSPTPFFVLDEVDAALDAGNVEKLATYLRQNSDTCQFVVVSLKDQLYHMADLLVGVLKDKDKESSRVLTFDLSGYAY